VAELWELYVLAVLRRAADGLGVRHGTRELAASGFLLRSEIDGAMLGALRPDALVSENGQTVGVVDAKYKQLHPTAFSTMGPQREDLYQLAAYLARFGREPGTLGLLAYPFDPARPELPLVESRSPWTLDDKTPVAFVTLPHDLEAAAAKLRSLLLRARTRRQQGHLAAVG
jgi:5-methylcytosine-specific restriction enzyme subunit McrC